MDSEQTAIGGRIRLARVAAGQSLRGTARRLDVSPATLSAIETGKTGVSIPRLQALAADLGTSVAQLVGERPLDDRPARTATDPADADWRTFPELDLDPALAAAIDSFVETGYHGATMRSIAGRAGISVPGIYHHYRDKQELLVRAFDLTMDELHWRVRAARAEAANGVDAVRLVVEALALYHTHRHKLAFIGASEMRSLTTENRIRIAESRNGIQYLLDETIDDAVADGSIADDRARIAGRAISTMCTALPQWFRLDGPTTPEQIAQQYAEFALAMIGENPPGKEKE